MSYEVFARKYRPQTFDDLVGQNHVSRTLKNAVEQNRLAHAYLFVGPRGTGKTSTARILAKALNCSNAKAPTKTPCGHCDNCREIAAGNSLDVLEIDGASNNGVEQVRELRDNVRYAPSKSRFKIYIIDEVHMLSSAAFNALLKTLEEPPAHVKFIFATTEPQKVLPTIISRCQRFDLHRIPTPLIARQLLEIAGKEKIKLTAPAANAIARGAEGGLRDAESMLDQLVAFCGETIEEKDVLSVFGFTSQQTVADFTTKMLSGDTPTALNLLQMECEAGKDMMKLMSDLIAYLRDLLVYKVKPDALNEETTVELSQIFAVQADQVKTNQILELIDQFAAAEGRMKWAPNKKLHFEVAVIKAIHSLQQTTLDEVIENLSALRDGKTPEARPAKTPPVTQPTTSPSKPSTSPPGPEARPAPREETIKMENPERVWASVVARIPKHRGFLRDLVKSAQFLGPQGRTCVLAFPPEEKAKIETVGNENNRKLLESLFSEVTGKSWAVKLTVKDDLKPMTTPEGKLVTVPGTSLVQEAMEMFGGEIKEAR